MKYYEELDWPAVPDEFCITDESYLAEHFDHVHPYPDYPFYRQYKPTNSGLIEIFQPFFDFDISDRIFYQVVKDGIAIHKDKGRVEIFNYVFETGGDDVYTRFYEEDKTTEAYSIKIPSNKWHRMNVGYFHTVTGIEIDRIALSIYEKA